MDAENSESNIQQGTQPLLPRDSNQTNQTRPLKLDTLTKLEVFGYSIGHFQNDLFAALWFNYLLYFLKNIVFRGNADSGMYAGIVMLAGQIADGLATPLVGFYSDKTNSKWGKRTPWYISGWIVVTISFLFVWIDFTTDNMALMIVYYIFFPSMLNIGWAAVQVAHMSLVPSLTLSRKTRDKLNNYRNTFTYFANLWVLMFAFVLFLVLDSDVLQFRVLSLGTFGVGVASSIFFVVVVKEKKLTEGCKQIRRELRKKIYQEGFHLQGGDNIADQLPSEEVSKVAKPAEDDDLEKWEVSNEESGDVRISENRNRSKSVIASVIDEVVPWKHWFKMPSFYVYGFVYMAVRLLVNVQSSLIIFYLQNVLGIAKGVNTDQSGLPPEFAIVPMVIYLSSTICSWYLKLAYSRIGRKKTFTLGAICALAGAIIMLFLGPSSQNYIYPTAVLMGIGQSVSLNTGITLIGEVVGAKGASGAFVFGCYSLLDKFANGIVLYLVINLKDVSDPANAEYVKICTTAFPGIATILAWILITIGKAADYDAGDVVMDHSDAGSKVKQTVN